MKGTVNGVNSKQKPSSRNGHIMFKKLKDKPVWLKPHGNRQQLKMRPERCEALDHALKIMMRSVMRGGREESKIKHHKHSLSQVIRLNIINNKSC